MGAGLNGLYLEPESMIGGMPNINLGPENNEVVGALVVVVVVVDVDVDVDVGSDGLKL